MVALSTRVANKCEPSNRSEDFEIFAVKKGNILKFNQYMLAGWLSTSYAVFYAGFRKLLDRVRQRAALPSAASATRAARGVICVLSGDPR